ncbi:MULTISPECIES: leucine efflux protein LeuE [Edwardsiella]|uniref:Lysine exporter protein (LYSE/YGGA) n=2 Tax=Edwardsiella anguillarum TaxID=1821960 RepID=A0A076LEW7_9GAMM|nr:MULTISPECIES: leucine efflux protein LeuE [Edwardsiella]AIJ07070.1 lysine exporter protein (LYSE/YGGA) [Edwardsiella anguillarum ET080813]AKR78455.1 leucine efflux protein LeuE [Edwardsiella sp. LADL05-105]KAB0588113.1 leucine efflux protein LeuE [Edwardsiella anguillarum]UOU78203.1 leucine efflux protein LeuE [Edwardsiella anguillarum]WHP82971.1 leucine efflux protein LeuE [Edwardsiella anguillarum]
MLESFGVLNIWTYVLGAIFIILVPGPNTLFVLKTGITGGIREGYKAASAVLIGDGVLIFLAYLGIASLIRSSPFLFNLIKMLGALYLLYLGIKILYSTLRHTPRQTSEERIEVIHTFRKALTLSLTNPKSILFYVSFFVQFIDLNYAHTGLSFLILASILECISICYMTFLIFSGAALAHFLGQKQRLARLGNSMVGLMFLGFASKLASATA